MKTIMLLSGALFYLFASDAFAYPVPKNFCYQGCSEEQKTIWNRYEAANTFEVYREAGVYSGACYHLTSMYRPDQPHYAGVLIDHDEMGELTFSGRFSFFAPRNYYADWDLATARREFTKRHLMEVGGPEAFLDLNPGGETIWYYWLRDDVQSDNLLLIASWGAFHQVFCELTPNEGMK